MELDFISEVYEKNGYSYIDNKPIKKWYQNMNGVRVWVGKIK